MEKPEYKSVPERVSLCADREDNERPFSCIGKGPSGIRKDVLEINN